MKPRLEVFLRYRYLLQDLIVKDIKVKYRRSVLGLLWSILNPLFMMLVITAVFERIFKIRVENFPIYYLTGSSIFNFFSEGTQLAMGSVFGASSLIKKVYIPKYIFPLEKVMFAFVNFMFSLVAVIIMFVVLRFPVPWTVVLFVIPAIYVLVFSIGIGLILSAMSVFFRDIVHLYSVLVVAWQYLTPIMYSYDSLPEAVKLFMCFNPMYYFVLYFRDVTMYGIVPGLDLNITCMAFALCSLLAGLLVFKKKQYKFILFI